MNDSRWKLKRKSKAMTTGDERIAKALRQLDIETLKRECLRRLNNAVEGTHIAFRTDRRNPPVWAGTTYGRGDERHVAMAEEAAHAMQEYENGVRYSVVRFYKDARSQRRTLKRGLTLYQAQQHCQDPETSSSTCRKPANRARTRRLGDWFDGYYRD